MEGKKEKGRGEKEEKEKRRKTKREEEIEEDKKEERKRRWGRKKGRIMAPTLTSSPVPAPSNLPAPQRWLQAQASKPQVLFNIAYSEAVWSISMR